MFTSHNVAETIGFGRSWSAALRPNDVVALSGDLGAGKTQFVKGLVAGCGSSDAVTSPTFTLLHEYRGGRLSIFHFDFYRIEQRSELEQIGFEELLSEGGVAIVEWADRFPEMLPPRTRWIRIAAGEGDERVISEGQ
jgi:tRNA threonylcarbamoyladenosine biosynthesis protein TsaE